MTTMSEHKCESCSLRARYDARPTSWLGRFWRWHIRFCPGWRRYVSSLPDDARRKLEQRYTISR